MQEDDYKDLLHLLTFKDRQAVILGGERMKGVGGEKDD